MATELEAKLKVDSHDAVRGRLREVGAELVGRVLEVNRIFDNGGGTLLASDCGLRVRECRDEREVGQAHNPSEAPVAHETVISAEAAEHAETAEKKILSRKQDVTGLHCGELCRAVLTYKGPRSAGELKRREEIEIEIDDPAAAGLMLERLGFVEAVCFEKRRESWRLGECLVELDEVPYLGKFVEIEGPREECIRRARSEVGLDEAPLVRGSYVGMLVRHCEANGLPAGRIGFGAEGAE